MKKVAAVNVSSHAKEPCIIFVLQEFYDDDGL